MLHLDRHAKITKSISSGGMYNNKARTIIIMHMLEHTQSSGHALPRKRVICYTLPRNRRMGHCKDKTATKKPFNESNKSPHTRTAPRATSNEQPGTVSRSRVQTVTRAASNEQPAIVSRDIVTNTVRRAARKQRDDLASNPSVSVPWSPGIKKELYSQDPQATDGCH